MEIIGGVVKTVLDCAIKALVRKNEIKGDIDLKRMKLINKKEARSEKLKRQLNKKLEKARNLMLNLAKEFSQDTTYQLSILKMSVIEYNNRYLEKCQDLNRFRTIIATHFAQLNGLADELAGRISVYWGQQQNLLYQIKKGSDNATYMEVLNRVTKVTFDIGDTVHSLKWGFTRISNELENR